MQWALSYATLYNARITEGAMRFIHLTIGLYDGIPWIQAVAAEFPINIQGIQSLVKKHGDALISDIVNYGIDICEQHMKKELGREYTQGDSEGWDFLFNYFSDARTCDTPISNDMSSETGIKRVSEQYGPEATKLSEVDWYSFFIHIYSGINKSDPELIQKNCLRGPFRAELELIHIVILKHGGDDTLEFWINLHKHALELSDKWRDYFENSIGKMLDGDVELCNDMLAYRLQFDEKIRQYDDFGLTHKFVPHTNYFQPVTINDIWNEFYTTQPQKFSDFISPPSTEVKIITLHFLEDPRGNKKLWQRKFDVNALHKAIEYGFKQCFILKKGINNQVVQRFIKTFLR